MDGVMDDHVGAMVGESAKTVGDENGDPPSSRPEPAHAERDRGLGAQDQGRNQRRPRIAAHQGTHLRMCLKDGAGALRVGLIKVGLVEGGLHRRRNYPKRWLKATPGLHRAVGLEKSAKLVS